MFSEMLTDDLLDKLEHALDKDKQKCWWKYTDSCPEGPGHHHASSRQDLTERRLEGAAPGVLRGI